MVIMKSSSDEVVLDISHITASKTVVIPERHIGLPEIDRVLINKSDNSVLVDIYYTMVEFPYIGNKAITHYAAGNFEYYISQSISSGSLSKIVGKELVEYTTIFSDDKIQTSLLKTKVITGISEISEIDVMEIIDEFESSAGIDNIKSVRAKVIELYNEWAEKAKILPFLNRERINLYGFNTPDDMYENIMGLFIIRLLAAITNNLQFNPTELAEHFQNVYSRKDVFRALAEIEIHLNEVVQVASTARTVNGDKVYISELHAQEIWKRRIQDVIDKPYLGEWYQAGFYQEEDVNRFISNGVDVNVALALEMNNG